MSTTAPHPQTYQEGTANLNSFGFHQTTAQSSPVAAQVLIDDKVVLKQKDKALKELDSRVKLASAQHNQMYKLQREHIVAEHDRQLQLAKTAIEDEKANALMALEQAYSQNVRSIEHSAQTQKISIEQQANVLEIHSIQHQMAVQHAERERQWTSNYSTPVYQPVSQPTQYFPQVQIPMFFQSNGSSNPQTSRQ